MFINEAFEFYSRFVYDSEKVAKLSQHGFSIDGTVPPIVWECFALILLGVSKKPGFGSDLEGWEVKSASDKNKSFEYQYHRNTGLSKFNEDVSINHLYITYGNEYKNVIVRMLSADTVKPHMDRWKPSLNKWYASTEHQRFRRSINRSIVESSGQILMRITDKKLVS